MNLSIVFAILLNFVAANQSIDVLSHNRFHRVLKLIANERERKEKKSTYLKCVTGHLSPESTKCTELYHYIMAAEANFGLNDNK